MSSSCYKPERKMAYFCQLARTCPVALFACDLREFQLRKGEACAVRCSAVDSMDRGRVG